MTYISILRGINVSGQKLIKMDALKLMYQNLGFKNVQSYVQSGNIIFSAPATDIKKLECKIEVQIKKDFGFEVPVIVLGMGDLGKIIKHNPFTNDTDKEASFLHVTFLSDYPITMDKLGIETKKQENEAVTFGEKVIYLYCPNGYGKTKLHNNFLESKLKVNATTRNWKTVNEIFRLAGEG